MWVILTFVFSMAIIALIISLIVLNDKKNEKIFKLCRRNILLQYEIEQVLKNRKRLDCVDINKAKSKRMTGVFDVFNNG
jgi:surface polysaccharide O-acyltransferase-like enzyme